MISKKNQILGGLYGALVGDALGVPVEFNPRKKLQNDPVISMREYGTWSQPAGTWSDDGSLLLCTVDSLIRSGFDPQDIGKNFVSWFAEGHLSAHDHVFDIGGTTQRAIENIIHGVDAEKAGGRTKDCNGNGSLMRILPVPLLFYKSNDMSDFCSKIERVSSITHAHSRSKLACSFYGILVRFLLHGEAPREAYMKTIEEFHKLYITHDEFPLFRMIFTEHLSEKGEDAISSGGYVMDTLEASIWCLLTTVNFKDCVLRAVNLGGDTDTTGCVAGGLAGITYGLNAIPEEWVNILPKKTTIPRLFDSFVDLVDKT